MSGFTISLIATTPHDIPIFQILPPVPPHPDLHRFAWVMDFALGHPHMTSGSDLYLWYPADNRFVPARVGAPFRVHEGCVFHVLNSTAFVAPQAIAIPLHHYYDPPPRRLVALRFRAYARPTSTDPSAAPRPSTEADHGHTLP